MGNLLVNDENIVVAKSPFGAYENEGVKYDGKLGKADIDDIMLKVQRNNIVAIDYVILEAVSELEFATSRMVTKYLHLRNIEIVQDKVHNRLKFMNKHKVVSRYKFFNNESETNLRIYCLEKPGRTLLLGRNYECKWKPTDSLRVEEMKEILARNQVLLSFRDKVDNLTSYEINPYFKLVKTTGHFRPHLLISISDNGKNEEILFEIARSYEGYIPKFIDRLRKYEEYYNHFQVTAEKPEPPKFIIVGEDDKHLFSIFKAILNEKITFKGMGVIYTHDLRLLDKEINKSFIRFDMRQENGKTKAKITELNYAPIKLKQNAKI